MLKRITKKTYIDADMLYDIMKEQLKLDDGVDDASEWCVCDSQVDDEGGITFVWERRQ